MIVSASRVMPQHETADLDQYYVLHQPQLCRYAMQKFGVSMSEAEDVVQAAFTRLAGPLKDEKIDNVRAFLYRTVHNACIDQIRRRKVRENYTQIKQAEDGAELDLRSPERAALGQQILQMISNALWAMPVKRRKLLLMNRIDGLSYAEISRREGLSETVVRKHVAKALADCQKALRSERGER